MIPDRVVTNYSTARTERIARTAIAVSEHEPEIGYALRVSGRIIFSSVTLFSVVPFLVIFHAGLGLFFAALSVLAFVFGFVCALAAGGAYSDEFAYRMTTVDINFPHLRATIERNRDVRLQEEWSDPTV